MAGLTDQAGGMKVTGGEAIERAHQAWQESMLRQLELLRAEIQSTSAGQAGSQLWRQSSRTSKSA